MTPTPRADLRLDAGIFLISFAILLLELLLTRIFSVTMYHHLSFLAVSLAMMGLGAGGLMVTLWPGRFRAGTHARLAAGGGLLFALTAVVVVWISFRLPIGLVFTAQNWRNSILLFTLCVVPFLAGGLAVALLFTHHARRANRLYSFDLLGAATACVAFIPLTNGMGAPSAVLLAAGVGALSGVLLAGRDARKLAVACGSVGAVLLVAAAVNALTGFYDIRVIKGEEQPPMLVSRWNSFSRVDVLGTEENRMRPRQPVSHGYSSRLPPVLVNELYLMYDAGALTQISRFDGDLTRLGHLRYDVTSAPYHLRSHRGVLVIGAGGGRDILTALSLGSGPVTAVEMNPITVELMRGEFRDYSGGLFDGYPGVTVIRGDGRSFIRASKERYQLIQASLVDTFAASAAGAHALSENSLYTVDAFRDYLDHLTPDGVIAFSRWFNDPPAETLRLVLIAAEALRGIGVPDPASHIVVVRSLMELTGRPSMATILIRKSPFPQEELDGLRRWAAVMEFVVVHAPDDPPDARPDPVFDLLLGPDAARFIAEAPFDLRLVTDERPFFFERVPLLAWIGHRLGLPAPASGRSELTLGGQTLLAALVVTLAFTILLVGAPWLAFRRREAAAGERAGLWVLYFVGLGLAYIVVEIVAIQRLNLYLGNPTYALSVVLFTMLSASGLGSLAAGRWLRVRSLPLLLAGVIVLLVATQYVMPLALGATLGSSVVTRIALAVLLIGPVAFLMGMPFPTALREVERRSTRLVAWGWAVNAGASVLGSVLAVLASMASGFTAALWMGILAYTVSLCTILLLNPR